MYCNYCGAPNPDDAKYCNKCGHAVVRPPAPQQPKIPNVESAPPDDQPTQKSVGDIGNEFSDTYSNMLDDELLHLAEEKESLTDIARDALAAELRKRGPSLRSSEQETQPLELGYYFSVSKQKLIVMSVFTLGLYQLYWFYKNWELIRRRTGRDIIPWVRAIFAIFFCYSLFKSVKESADSHGIHSAISPAGLALAYIAITLCVRLPDPYWLVSLLAFLPLLPAQGAINNINSNTVPIADPNDRYTGKNVIILILGSFLLIITVLGTLVPE